MQAQVCIILKQLMKPSVLVGLTVNPIKGTVKNYYQFFSKRKPNSNWSKVNKDKVARLLKQGLMAAAGLEAIRIAKERGTWTALDEVEQLLVPPDLQKLFDKNKTAAGYWEKFPPSAKRGILEWILNAKKPETRLKRIQQTVELAEKKYQSQFSRPENLNICYRPSLYKGSTFVVTLLENCNAKNHFLL